MPETAQDLQKTPAAAKKEPLEKAAQFLLEECRMVLPGIQAIFGFQLIAFFNNGFFQHLSPAEQQAHLVAVLLMVLAIGCTLTPASYHRIAETDTVSQTFVTLASWLLSLGMVFLMAGMSVDLYLVARIGLGSKLAAATVATVATMFLCGLWFVFPLARRLRR